MSKKTKDKADVEASKSEHLETETQSADANQDDSSAVGTIDLGSDTATNGTGELADARDDDGVDRPAPEVETHDGASPTADGEHGALQVGGEVSAVLNQPETNSVPAAELVGDHAIQKDVPADGTAAEGNGEGSQPSDEGAQEAEGAAEGSIVAGGGEASEGVAGSEPAVRDSELTYRPLMSDEDIARAATDAAIAVAYQAGFASTLTDEDELVLKLIAPVAVDFIKQWPDAPLEAMYVHIAISAGLPYDRFSTRPNWVRLGLAVFHSVVRLSIDAVKVHEKEWEAAKVRQAGLRWMAVDRADLAMMPEDDNPLSELGQAAARS